MSRFDPELLARALAALEAPERRAETAKDNDDLVIELAADLCRRFEGFRSHPYLCPAGVPTIGYGSTHYADGRIVTLGDTPLTREQGERLLMLELRKTYWPAVKRQCPAIEGAARSAGALDWTYNLGEGNLRASTLRRVINAGKWSEVPAQLRRWVRGGGRVLPGLVARREAEIRLIEA